MGVGHLVLLLGLLAPLGRALTLPGEGKSVKRDPADAVARIMWRYNWNKHEFLCFGILLKPWILLTVGDCVYNMNPAFFFVILQRLNDVTVRVAKTSLHPKYIYGDNTYNLALLTLSGVFNWDKYLFNLPRAHHSPGELLGMNSVTYINHLEDIGEIKNLKYNLSTSKVKVSLDYKNDCGVGYSREFYCVQVQFRANWIVGYPLFLYTGDTKRCLGIYTGHILNRSEQNQLFLDIYSSYHWIDEYFHRLQMPPN